MSTTEKSDAKNSEKEKLTSEKELQQAVATLELYKLQLDNYLRKQELIRLSLEEFIRARETLNSYKNENEGANILLPIGANSFLFAKAASPDKTISSIGSGISVEEPIDKAIEKFDKRIDEIRAADKAVAEKISKLERDAMTLTNAIQSKYTKLQKNNVRNKQ